ncbi:MAG: hypothetical protein RLZZ324_302, partial [Candidatus Parcubacteria bacterium]
MRLLPKFLISVLGIVVIAGAAAVIASTYLTQESLRKNLEQTQINDSRKSLDVIDRFLYERYDDIQSIAADEIVQERLGFHDPLVTPAIFERKMQDMLVITGPWEALEIVSPSGTIAYTTLEGAKTGNVFEVKSDGAVFKAALAGSVAYSDAGFDERLGRMTMAFAAPIRDPLHIEQVKGVMVGHLSWPALLDLIRDGDTHAIDVHDSSGVLIAGSEGFDYTKPPADVKDTLLLHRALAGGEGALVETEPGEEETLATYVHEKGYLGYKGNGWVLVSRTPTAISFAPAIRFEVQSMLVLLFVIVLSTVLAMLFLGKLTAPLRLLTQKSRAMSNGDPSVLAKAVTLPKSVLESRDEVGD